MAKMFLQSQGIDHDHTHYSLDKVRAMIEQMRQDPERAEEAARLESLFEKYPEQFCALYRIKDRAFVDPDEGESLSMTFSEQPYHSPAVDTEKNDTILPETQLELVCTFEDGSTFGLSALPATPKTADKDEPAQLRGEIHFPEETLKTLNEEKFNRIIDFCHTYGFSTSGLTLPTYSGEIDVDEKLAQLLAEYNKKMEAADTDALPSVKPSEDEMSDEGFRKEDFYALVDEADEAEMTPASPEEEKTPELAEEIKEEGGLHTPAPSKRMSLNEMVGNVRLFIEKDLQKRYKLSYWEHKRTIDGRTSYVFSIYDKENAKNWSEDGRKNKDDEYVCKASCRLMVSQDRSGKFFFGYSTPNGAPMKDTLATDFVGEIKKAGITHLNFKNIPKVDKMTWMVACAENGIIPSNLSFSKGKVEKMLQSARAKLSTEEYAQFIDRLMDQWEEETAKKGKTLAVSDQEYIAKCRNDVIHQREDQYGQLEKAEFEKKFKNFRDAYGAPDGLLTKVNKLIVSGSRDFKSGAATSIAAMSTLSRTFDVVLGINDDKKGALDITLGERLEELMKNPMTDDKGRPTVIRITEEEKRILAPLAGKQIKNLTKDDYLTIFNLLYQRQLKETKRTIVDIIKGDMAAKIHVKEHLLVEQRVWNGPLGEVRQVNEALRKIGAGVDALTLPDKHSGLPVDELRAIAEKEYEAEKAAKEEAEKGSPKPTPERGRGDR